MDTGKSQSILVVEDEASIASFVSLYLKNAGYAVRTAATGGEALAQVMSSTPALIVLDLNLPDIDGIEVCRRIRKTGDVPILMLTARDEDVDKIIGLEVGADDYLTKPFNPRELVARVKSVPAPRREPTASSSRAAVIAHGDLVVDAGRREVRVGDEEIQLAPKEFDLLWELLDHRGLVLTRDQLLERVWGYTFAGDTRTVDVHVRQLRRKLGEASPIVTVWGVGYKVSPAREAAAAPNGRRRVPLTPLPVPGALPRRRHPLRSRFGRDRLPAAAVVHARRARSELRREAAGSRASTRAGDRLERPAPRTAGGGDQRPHLLRALGPGIDLFPPNEYRSCGSCRAARSTSARSGGEDPAVRILPPGRRNLVAVAEPLICDGTFWGAIVVTKPKDQLSTRVVAAARAAGSRAARRAHRRRASRLPLTSAHAARARPLARRRRGRAGQLRGRGARSARR